MKLTVGDILLNEIEGNLYFKDLYKRLLSMYGEFIVNGSTTTEFSDEEIDDILRFADILSKSNVSNKISFHRNIAQDIAIMLSVICNNQNKKAGKISFYEKNILMSTSNYSGISKIKEAPVVALNNDFISDYADEIKKEFNKVEGTQNEYYFDPQRKALQMMNDMQYYSFSAPTSMGKTFIIKNFLRSKIIEPQCKCIALILPTKALINEIEEDLIEEYSELLNLNHYIVLTVPTQITLFSSENKILLFTPERMLQAVNEQSIEEINYFFIDEAQKIFEDDERAPLYYKLLEKVNKDMPLAKIIFSSPYAENPDVLLQLINNPYIVNKKELSNFEKFDFSPVSQKQFIIDVKGKHTEIYNQLEKSFLEIKATNNYYWCDLIMEQTKKGPTIVYCKSKIDVIKYSNQYLGSIKDEVEITDELGELIQNVENEINPDYYLIPLLKKGIAFHIGVMPSIIRKKIENLMKKKIIKVVFCTSTLLEGVNLPAVNIFIMSHKKSTQKLSILEFKNLIGRAGRIKYNLWGNAFLLNVAEDLSYGKYQHYLKATLKQNTLQPQVSGRIQEMVPSLYNNNYKIIKKSSESYASIAKFVMFRNLLYEAIANSQKNSIIFRYYEEDINKIMQDGNSLINVDIGDLNDLKFAPEIINDVRNAIVKNEINLPILAKIEDIDDEQDSEAIKEQKKQIIEENAKSLEVFFGQLYIVFKWEQFHSKLELGAYTYLPSLARTVSKWISSQRLSKIIFGKLQYYRLKKQRYSHETFRNEFYGDTIHERNEVIMEIMENIETIIKYKLSNYVAKFIEIYKKVKNVDINNSIADYIDYGTMNDVVITLQKLGISRELSNEVYIKKHYYFDEKGKLKISNKEKLLSNKAYKEEMFYISKNLLGLFD